MGSYTVKVLLALAAAGILLYLAHRWKRKTKRRAVPLQSLPKELVQEIADRLTDPAELLQFLSGFFQTPYDGKEEKITEQSIFVELLQKYGLNEEEIQDKLRVIAAIEPDALLAYAAAEGDREKSETPVILTVCKCEDEPGLWVGVFRPVNGSVTEAPCE